MKKICLLNLINLICKYLIGYVENTLIHCFEEFLQTHPR